MACLTTRMDSDYLLASLNRRSPRAGSEVARSAAFALDFFAVQRAYSLVTSVLLEYARRDSTQAGTLVPRSSRL